MFDKVYLIYKGRMVYLGLANRQTTSDFLVAVTHLSGQQVRDGIHGVPSIAEEFTRYHQQSSIMEENLEAWHLFGNKTWRSES